MKLRTPWTYAMLLAGLGCSTEVAVELGSEAEAMPPAYGETDFQATGAAEAYPSFVKGLLQLHSFEYEAARASFREAQEIDGGFYMAYWGEALTHKQPLWNVEDQDAARAALAKLADTPDARLELAATERERAYMASVNRLFSGEGTELEIETDYAEMLGAIYERWPDDLDAGALYALAILTTSHDGREFDKFMRAAAVTEEILDHAPHHPGALHYNIHSYDDPIHAPLGLRAARLYADVAPDAVHALHMPSHIFFALGDFEGVRDLNRRSYEAAVARQAGQADPERGLFRHEVYHSHSWLLYAHIQLHEFEEARAMLDDVASRMAEGDTLADGNLVTGRAFLVLETENWEDPLLDIEVDFERLGAQQRATEQYIRTRRALAQGDVGAAEQHLAELVVPEESGSRPHQQAPKLLNDIGRGQLLIAQGEVEDGIALLKAAAAHEDSLPPHIGPPASVQPAGEAAGDALAAQGHDEEAARYYAMTLKRAVNKTRSRNAIEALTGRS